MTKDMVAIESSAVDFVGQDKKLPFMERVPDELLSDCIFKVTSGEMEVAARLGFWKYLNHDYRVAYRLHRDAEEAAIKSAWDEADPDLRTWWDKLLRRKPIVFKRPINSPFTIPVFETTQEQRQNMQRLGEVLLELAKATGRNYVLELAELYREQGHFHAAELELSALDDGQVGVIS